MNYLTLGYYLLVAAAFLFYYLLPLRHRWIILLGASIAFYAIADFSGLPALAWMIVTSFFLAKQVRKSGLLLVASIAVSVLPFWVHLLAQVVSRELPGLFLPLGLSYISLQIIAYLADCARGKMEPDANLFQYALFLSFFPQVVQGPIPRYDTLSGQLKEGHVLEEDNVIAGFLKILCGLYLKYLLADRAAVAANTFYQEAGVYTGIAAWIGAAMYLIQLYTDFFACVLLSQGVARLFGIRLGTNFDHPFTSQSIAEVWRRWHMSLGAFFRDYLYLPLGGSRRGPVRKYLNVTIVFVASALWHGVSLTYLAWGLLTALYQVIGAGTLGWRDRLYEALHIPAAVKKRMRQMFTAALFLLSSVLFRSYGFRSLLGNVRSLIQMRALPAEDGFLGMSVLEWSLFAVFFAVFVLIQHWNQSHDPEHLFLQKWWGFRFGFYTVMILLLLVFGTYGFGYDAQAFIYGAF